MVSTIEPCVINDIYADDVAGVEVLGSNVRISYFTWERGERVIVAKLIRPIASLQVGAVLKMVEAAKAVTPQSEVVALH